MCNPLPAQRCSSHQRNTFNASVEKLLQAGGDPEAKAKHVRRAAAEAERWLWTPDGIAYLQERGDIELAEKIENYRKSRSRMVKMFNSAIAGIQDPAIKRARILEMNESLDRAAPSVPPTLVSSLIDDELKRQTKIREKRSAYASRTRRDVAPPTQPESATERQERARRERREARKERIAAVSDPTPVLRVLASTTEGAQAIREDISGAIGETADALRSKVRGVFKSGKTDN